MSFSEFAALVGQWGQGHPVVVESRGGASSTFCGVTAIGTPATVTVACAVPSDGVYEVAVAVKVNSVKRRYRAAWRIGDDGTPGRVRVTGPAGDEVDLPPFPAGDEPGFYPAQPTTPAEAETAFVTIATAIASLPSIDLLPQ